MLTKPILIKLDAEKPTDCKQAEYRRAAVTTERIGLQTGVCDSLNITGIKNRKNSAEMTESFPNGKSNNMQMLHLTLTLTLKTMNCKKQLSRTGSYLQECKISKSSLIDLNAEMPTRAKTITGYAERLNEKTPRNGDAIVRSHTNKKYEKLAEMTNSYLLEIVNRVTSGKQQSRQDLCRYILKNLL